MIKFAFDKLQDMPVCIQFLPKCASPYDCDYRVNSYTNFPKEHVLFDPVESNGCSHALSKQIFQCEQFFLQRVNREKKINATVKRKALHANLSFSSKSLSISPIDKLKR